MHSITSTLRCGDRALNEPRLHVMGVVNVTPDSFSDGGIFYAQDQAIEQALKLLNEGADIIDIGGVATSPHIDVTTVVPVAEEKRRVLPVIEELVKRGIRNISIDTSRAEVALEALALGAAWINDQSAGLRDARMPSVMCKAEGVVLMHNEGGPSGVDAGERVVYHNIIDHLLAFFRVRIAALTAAGVKPERIIVDPGVGFGKGLTDSLAIINSMHRFDEVCANHLIGVSRKSFLYPISGIKDPKERDFASLGAQAAAILSGARMIRTHNVRAAVEMARTFAQCLAAAGTGEADENLHQARR